MRTLGLLGTVLVILGLAGCSGKAQTNAEKIVGKWKVVKSEGDVGMIISFTSACTTTVCANEEAKDEKKSAYKIEGDKLTITREGGKAETGTIKTLTDKKLVLADVKGEEMEFEKIP